MTDKVATPFQLSNPETRNLFITRTNTPGSFIQPDPEPVVFTDEFNRGLNELAGKVAIALAKVDNIKI